jgi:hypothetical protein
MSSGVLMGFKRWHGVSEISIQGEKFNWDLTATIQILC